MRCFWSEHMTIKQWFVNEGPMYTFVLIWMCINALLFGLTYQQYLADKYDFMRDMIGYGLPIARGAAGVLNFNCAIILLPVCRNLVNFSRGAFESKRSIRRLFDKNILFHKYCAYVICIFAAIHICAHIYNVNHLVNKGFYKVDNKTPEQALFTTVAGGTGVGITLSLILMVSTASEQIRRSYFELFWYTHHLFVVFYLCLCLHGYSGFIVRQDGNELKDGSAMTWMWVIGPLALYIFERLYRYYRCHFNRLRIRKVVKHNDSVPVMEIQFDKVPSKAGQYVFIQCPAVSQFEWHPFTLTSCPELDYLSLHIRLVGDWTTAFADKCGFYDEIKTGAALPSVAIDGPFGTASEDVYRYEVAMLVAAGIGVTPFASLLQALYFRKCNPEKYPKFKTQKVYFYWICPGFDAWGWFANLLMDMEDKLAEIGEPDFLTIRVFMTRGWSNDDAAKIMLQEDENGDVIVRDQQTGRALKHKMNYGRPMWDREFATIADTHAGTNVGLFFCGPKILSTQLHDNCNKFTAQRASQGTKFFYNKENF